MAHFMNQKYNHIVMDCRTGKTLNPHTCVFVKDCKPGYMRNDKFQCRKDAQAKSNATNKVKSNATNKVKSPKTKNKVKSPNTSPKSKTSISQAKSNAKNVGSFNRTHKDFNTTRKKLKAYGFVARIPTNMTTNYDEDTVFVFYSKSSDAAPGKGANEKIPDEKREMYADLDKIPDWRKRLSNFWVQPFYKQGFVWASVEHYYQASKFKMEHNDFYKQFSLDKGTALSKDPLLAKVTGGKDLKHKYRPKEITVDSDFFPKRAQQEMFRAQHAKFTQNADLKELLKATKKAKLMHYTRGGKLETFDGLMYIRDHML
jgi:predicted NAD-dependent protein-ADP-ribosyltransferase YbiA (DUF1768 family)